MPDARIARALLRLYPRDWRERYGDELLALVSQSGFGWRVAIDIFIVGCIERLRALLALAQAEITASAPLPPQTPLTDREFFLAQFCTAALIAALVLASTLFGMPSPQWSTWFWLLIPSQYFDSDNRVTRATISERIVLTFAWFVISLWMTIVGWLTGDGLRQLGVPEPSDGFLLLAAALLFVPGWMRLLYRGIASALNKPRPTMKRREVVGWSVGLFAFAVLIGVVDPKGESIWMTTSMWVTWLHFTRTRCVRDARRQELRQLRGF